jgi:DNA-binding protein HU-beta
MNKAELIDAIAEKASLSKADAKSFLDAFTDIATTSLINGDRVVLSKFGTFSVIKRTARTGRNPATGAPITVPEKTIVKFKPGLNLRAKVQ